MTHDLTLYGFVTSPFVGKVHTYLLYKGLDFNVVYVNPFRIRAEVPVGRRVPVLTIDGESRPESQDIGRWLDERFPDTPPLVFGDDAQRQAIVELDDWITHNFIRLKFASAVPRLDGRLPTTLGACWRLGRTVRDTTPQVPGAAWMFWPLVIRAAPFIRRLSKPYRGCDLDAMQAELLEYLDGILAKQDFLVVPDRPSMPDLSLWPQLMVAVALGIGTRDALEPYPALEAWTARMAPYVNHQKDGHDLPPLVPDHVRRAAIY